MTGYAQTVGRCTHCALTDRVTELLSDANGTISPQLMPFAGFLLATSTPQYLWSWLHRSAGARLIAQLATSTAPIDHHALDQLPQSQEVIHLRQLLIAADVLPRRFEPLALLEPWLDRQLTARPRSHDLLIRPFAQWIVLRRARNAHRHGRFTYGSAGNSRGRLRQALHLLDWLTAQQRSIAELTQADLDQWLTEGSHYTRRDVASFLAWTAARRLTPKLTVARQRSDIPTWFLDEDQHLNLLRRCLTDTSLPLTVRVAGALILLYGARATTVAALTTEHLSTGSRGAYLSLGDTPALLPPTLAELINDLAAQPHRFAAAVRQPRYLLPGQPPTRPINPASLSALLGRYGIPARASRNTALITLAADLPAPVLASLIGVAPATADDWSRWAQVDWGSYLAARDAIPE
ncbi:hypothetical protein [Actinoplanes sp. NPDC049316]|uniref:hypothetical protein n=1 Tax=Actinoplanes sp. NPDC049316 TaxID=3154727 RepID=UPI003414453B